MNMLRLRPALLPFLGLAAVSGAFAAPVKLADIAPDCAWFAHVDFDKAAGGKLVPAIVEQARRRNPGMDARLAEFTEKTGVDLAKDIRGVTFYGDDTRDSAAILIYHSASVAKLREGVAKENKTETTVVDGVTVLKEAKADPKDEVYQVINDNGPVVLARDSRTAVAAVKALGGKGVVPGAEWAEATAGRSPLFVLSAHIDRLPSEKARFARIKDAKSATFVVEDTGDILALTLKATMADADAAKKAADMARGLGAFASANAKDPVRSALLAGFKADSTGAMVALELPAPVKDLVALVENDGNPREKSSGKTTAVK